MFSASVHKYGNLRGERDTSCCNTVKWVDNMRVVGLFFYLFTVALSSWGLSQPRVTTLGPYGGDVRSLAVHPQRPHVFFLGTPDGQIFISEDAGGRWRKLAPGLDRRNLVIDNLAFDPIDPNTLYAATWELKSDKGWLFRTRDGGQTWQEISLKRFNSAIRAIAIAPSDPQRIALGISEGVLLSVDGGLSWDRITRGYRSMYNVESLAFDPRDPDTLYVGTWHLGFKTTNRGKKWTAMHSGMVFDSDMFSLLVNPQKPEVLFSSACTGIYKSENGGLNWKKLKNGLPKEAKRTRTLHLDPSNSNTIYAGTTVGLFVSHNAGSSWKKLISDVVINTVATDPADNRVILVGADDAGVLKSTDGGLTFHPANSGFVHRQVVAVTSDSHHQDHYYASVSSDGSYGGFFFSHDRGITWEPFNEGLENILRADLKTILPAGLTQRVYIGTQQGIFTGLPSREPWRSIDTTHKLSVFDLTFADTREQGIFLATEEGIFHLDLAENHLTRLEISDHEGKVNAVFYDPGTARLFAATDKGLFRSENGGKTWSREVEGLPDAPIHVLEKSGQRLFTGTRDGLFFSDDGGKQWSRSEGVFPIDIIAIQANPRADNQVFATDSVSGHLYYTGNGGNEWEIIQRGLHSSSIAALGFNTSGELLAGTISDGVYLIEPPAQWTAEGR